MKKLNVKEVVKVELKELMEGVILIGRIVVEVIKGGVKETLWCFIVFAFFFVALRLDVSPFKISYADLKCTPAGTPEELEIFELRQYDLKYAEENYNKYPDSPEVLNRLIEAKADYEEAFEKAEEYKKTEDYEYYKAGICRSSRQGD